MINLPTFDELAQASTHVTDATLKRLLEERAADTAHCGLQEYTHVLVIEEDDREQQIVEAIGFSPLKTRIDGIENCPDWDWSEWHSGWWELLYTVGNDGFAFILLVEDSDSSPLARLCRKEGCGA